MKPKEAQLLGIFAMIAAAIILLCLWGGGEKEEGPSVKAQEAEPEIRMSELDETLALLEALERRMDSASSPEVATVKVEIGGDAKGAARESSVAGSEAVLAEKIEKTAPQDILLKAESSSDSAATEEKKPLALEYVVAKGDTLWGLSLKYYKTGSKWKLIRNANKDVLSGGTELRPKMKLVIPALQTAAVSIAPTKLTIKTPPAGRTYKVKKGDTLYGIARKFYNNPRKWRDILEANNLRSERDLRIGMMLVIP